MRFVRLPMFEEIAEIGPPRMRPALLSGPNLRHLDLTPA
jgi:hypothetical protein